MALPSLCKSELSLCWQLSEMGGGVDDMYCALCDPQRGSFKTRKQLITTVTSSAEMSNWKAAEIQEMLASPWSL